MQKLLIVGIDTVVGANLAVALGDRFRISGLPNRLRATGRRTTTCRVSREESACESISAEQPDWLVYCGSAAQSSWESPCPSLTDNDEIDTVCQWARAATEIDCGFVLVSSDAVFTGPWMFHDENSASVCNSRQANEIRRLEGRVLAVDPGSLIVRTNAIGWTPQISGAGWIEDILSQLELQRPVSCDSVRHGTPILSSDLAEILSLAIERQLHGVYHIAGAERVNPLQFAQRLSQEFSLPAPLPTTSASLTQRPEGFGRGESSLKTTKIRKQLGVTMPVLDECLSRLLEQSENGYRDRLNGTNVQEMVA